MDKSKCCARFTHMLLHELCLKDPSNFVRTAVSLGHMARGPSNFPHVQFDIIILVNKLALG